MAVDQEIANEAQALQELLTTLDPEARTLYAESILGRDAAEFLGTELGQYMVGCARQEYQDAVEKLKTVGWWRRRRIMDLQNQAWRAESFLGWMRDLVIRGKAAEVALDDKEGGL